MKPYRTSGRAKRKTTNRTPFILLASIFIFSFAFVIVINLVNVNANKNVNSSMKREYISIEINNGDTLDSIARTYMGVGYSNVNSYINDIKEVNGLTDNTIYAGNHIIIPRYVTVVEAE